MEPRERRNRTDYLTVNGIDVRLVVLVDDEGTEFVRVEAEDGDLEGVEPGVYEPRPLAA